MVTRTYAAFTSNPGWQPFGYAGGIVAGGVELDGFGGHVAQYGGIEGTMDRSMSHWECISLTKAGSERFGAGIWKTHETGGLYVYFGRLPITRSGHVGFGFELKPVSDLIDETLSSWSQYLSLC